MKNKYKNIHRMCEACLSYQDNKMTLKQVWYRVRGPKNMRLIQEYPDKILGARLLWLYLDFQTWSSKENSIIEESILSVANYLLKQQKDSIIH